MDQPIQQQTHAPCLWARSWNYVHIHITPPPPPALPPPPASPPIASPPSFKFNAYLHEYNTYVRKRHEFFVRQLATDMAAEDRAQRERAIHFVVHDEVIPNTPLVHKRKRTNPHPPRYITDDMLESSDDGSE